MRFWKMPDAGPYPSRPPPYHSPMAIKKESPNWHALSYNSPQMIF